MKYLTFSDEKSNKFWAAIELTDGKILAQYGKKNSHGTIVTYSETKKLNSLVSSKLKKGYIETEPVMVSIFRMCDVERLATWNNINNKKQKKKMNKKDNNNNAKKVKKIKNANKKETEIIIQFIQNEFKNDNYDYDYLRREDYLTIADIKQVNAGQIDIKIIVPQDYESSEMLTQEILQKEYHYGEEDYVLDGRPYGWFYGENDSDYAVTGGGADFYIKASKSLYHHIKKIKGERDSRPEEIQELEKVEKDISQMESMINTYKGRIKELEKSIFEEKKKKDNLSKIIRVKKRGFNPDGYRGKVWDSAVKFVQNQLGYDEYLASAWIRPISGKVKKGESQHEWAYFEPCNRGNGGMGMSMVGINSWENPHQGCSLTREGILGLFNTDDETLLKKMNLRFDKMEKLQEKDDEYSYEEYEEILYDTIDKLMDSLGFEKINRLRGE